MSEELMTLKEAAEFLKCHPNTLRNWDRKGILNAVRFGKRGDRRFRREDVENMVNYSEDEAKISDVFGFHKTTEEYIPLFSSTVPAGFPSPAEDFVEDTLDLNEYMVHHPAATFFVRVSGNSMINAGIHQDDILVVDRALKASNNSIAIVALNGELTVKRVSLEKEKLFLMPENPTYSPIEVTPDEQFDIWGIVTHVIHPTT